MTPEVLLVATLENDSGVSALVDDRIYADDITLCKVVPSLIYQRESTDAHYDLHGSLLYEVVTLIIICKAETRSQADAIIAACEIALRAAKFRQQVREGGFEPQVDQNTSAAAFSFFYCP